MSGSNPSNCPPGASRTGTNRGWSGDSQRKNLSGKKKSRKMTSKKGKNYPRRRKVRIRGNRKCRRS